MDILWVGTDQGCQRQPSGSLPLASGLCLHRTLPPAERLIQKGCLFLLYLAWIKLSFAPQTTDEQIPFLTSKDRISGSVGAWAHPVGFTQGMLIHLSSVFGPECLFLPSVLWEWVLNVTVTYSIRKMINTVETSCEEWRQEADVWCEWRGGRLWKMKSHAQSKKLGKFSSL